MRDLEVVQDRAPILREPARAFDLRADCAAAAARRAGKRGRYQVGHHPWEQQRADHHR